MNRFNQRLEIGEAKEVVRRTVDSSRRTVEREVTKAKRHRDRMGRSRICLTGVP